MPLEHLYRQRVLFWKYPNCCLMQITWLITKVDACAMKGIFKCTTKLSNLAKARSPAACISTVSCVAQMFGPSMRSIGRWGGSLGTDKAEGGGEPQNLNAPVVLTSRFPRPRHLHSTKSWWNHPWFSLKTSSACSSKNPVAPSAWTGNVWEKKFQNWCATCSSTTGSWWSVLRLLHGNVTRK